MAIDSQLGKSKESSTVRSAGRIGVVTVTYNSASVLPEFFDSLAAQTCCEYTLYVVDNASTDDTLVMCQQRKDLPVVLLANHENVGIAEGNNQGIRAALADGSEYILLLNNDTAFGPHLLAELRASLLNHECSMTTPKIFYYALPNTIWAAGGYFQRWLGNRPKHYGEGAEDIGQYNKSRPITYAPTCCVLIHRSVFTAIGLMDPLYFLYWDDVDFMYRAWKAGHVLFYVAETTLRHKVSSLAGRESKPQLVRLAIRNRIYFTKKHIKRGPAQLWIAAYRIYLYLRYLSGKDTKQEWSWKSVAIREGLAMG